MRLKSSTDRMRSRRRKLPWSALLASGILVAVSTSALAQEQEPTAAEESEPFAQLSILRDHFQEQRFVVVAVPMGPPVQIPRFRCPSGYELLEPVTNPFCQQPVEGTCTTYWCREPGTGRMILATPTFTTDTNPSCQGNPRQTEPCSNDVKVPERFVPSREQLVKTAPMLFPKELAEVPIRKPSK